MAVVHGREDITEDAVEEHEGIRVLSIRPLFSKEGLLAVEGPLIRWEWTRGAGTMIAGSAGLRRRPHAVQVIQLSILLDAKHLVCIAYQSELFLRSPLFLRRGVGRQLVRMGLKCSLLVPFLHFFLCSIPIDS